MKKFFVFIILLFVLAGNAFSSIIFINNSYETEQQKEEKEFENEANNYADEFIEKNEIEKRELEFYKKYVGEYKRLKNDEEFSIYMNKKIAERFINIKEQNESKEMNIVVFITIVSVISIIGVIIIIDTSVGRHE